MVYLLWKDYKELLSNKRTIRIIIVVLIILIISTYYNVKNQENDLLASKIEFGIVDEDDSSYSKLLLEYFNNSESFSSSAIITIGKTEEIETSFKKGELDVYIKIPKDFAQNMINIEHLPVDVYINQQDTTKALVIKNILKSYEKYISAVEINCVALYDVMEFAGLEYDYINRKNLEISYELIYTALGKDDFFQYHEIEDFPSTSLLTYFTNGVLAILILYIGLYVGFLLLKEKKNSTLKRLKTTNMKMSTVLMEKIVFSTTVVYIPLVTCYLFITIFLGQSFHVKLMIAYLCAILVSITFSLLLSSLFYDITSYLVAANFINFLFCIIGGGIIPIMYLPTKLADLSKFTPVYQFIRMFIKIPNGMDNRLFVTTCIVLILLSLSFLLFSSLALRREVIYLEE